MKESMERVLAICSFGGLGLFLLCFFQNCKEKIDTELVELRFVLPFEIEPNKIEYKIGDTLWLSSNFPDTVYDIISAQYIGVENQPFPTSVGIMKLLGKEFTLGTQPGAASFFEVVNVIGATSNQFETFNQLKIEYNLDRYKCKIGFVARAPGVFCLNLLSPKAEAVDFSLIDLGYGENGLKRKGYYTQFYYVINDGNVNLQLLRENCTLGSDTLPIEPNIFYEQKGTFTFRVVN